MQLDNTSDSDSGDPRFESAQVDQKPRGRLLSAPRLLNLLINFAMQKADKTALNCGKNGIGPAEI